MIPGQTFLVRLTPRAAHNRVGDSVMLLTGEQQIHLYVTTPPEDGKANAAMLKLLAAHLGVAPSRLSIMKGHTARVKIVRFDG